MKREKIVIQVKGFFLPISTHSIPLENIERIIPTETVDGDVALEFMGDNIGSVLMGIIMLKRLLNFEN